MDRIIKMTEPFADMSGMISFVGGLVIFYLYRSRQTDAQTCLFRDNWCIVLVDRSNYMYLWFQFNESVSNRCRQF